MSWQYHPKIECDYFEERIGVWKDITRLVSTPRKYTEKSLIPLWSFYTLVPRIDRELASDGKHWRACGANMAELNAFQIDYDSGVMQIEQFIENHLGLDYALYTSPSHKTDHHKFRVIIPLAKPLLNAYMTRGKVREYLLSMFPECDISTINSFRKQRMPAQPLSGDPYVFRIGEGARLVLDMAEIARLSALTEDRESPQEPVNLSQDYDPFDTPIQAIEAKKELRRLMEKYALDLPILRETPRGGGIVHASLLRMATALHHAGMQQADAQEYFASHGFMGTEINNILKWKV